MADRNIIDRKELLDKARGLESFELLRGLLTEVVQTVFAAERDEHLGASRYERAEGRQYTRSGYKPKSLLTAVGELELLRPQTRYGYSSALLERYARVDQSVLTMASPERN